MSRLIIFLFACCDFQLKIICFGRQRTCCKFSEVTWRIKCLIKIENNLSGGIRFFCVKKSTGAISFNSACPIGKNNKKFISLNYRIERICFFILCKLKRIKCSVNILCPDYRRNNYFFRRIVRNCFCCYFPR